MIQLKKVEDGLIVFVNSPAIALIDPDGETKCRVFLQAGSATGAAVCIYAVMSSTKVLRQIEDWQHDRAKLLRR